MNREIERLGRLACRIDRYSSELVKNLARTDLKCEAEVLGYSYLHWSLTGRWMKYSDLETEFKPVSKPIQKPETVIEVKRIETVKKPSIRKETVILLETETNNETEKVCEFCKNRFVSKRSVKRFCTDKCKRDFNNLKRYRNG